VNQRKTLSAKKIFLNVLKLVQIFVRGQLKKIMNLVNVFLFATNLVGKSFVRRL
jgi:hypothetical protein